MKQRVQTTWWEFAEALLRSVSSELHGALSFPHRLACLRLSLGSINMPYHGFPACPGSLTGKFEDPSRLSAKNRWAL